MTGDDTIVALSSGALPSGVAIIRLSGPRVEMILRELVGSVPAPRMLQLRDFAKGSMVFDRGLVAYFPAPFSFTGEDCAEFHVHGSSAIVRAMLSAITAFDEVRLAREGEFSRRAFDNGKLDLSEIEGLSDLIEAETESQRIQALGRMAGGLSDRIDNWREQLLYMRAELEAHLDFSDEGDVGKDLSSVFERKMLELYDDLNEALAGVNHGRIIREGFRVALAGPVNAGKSSLINRLVKSDLAIVSEEAGTTRDVREVPLDIDGQLVIFVDMAGIRQSDSIAETEGVKRALKEIADSDLTLWLIPPDCDGEPELPKGRAPIVRLASKIDLGRSEKQFDLAISTKTGEGIDELLCLVKRNITANDMNEPGSLLFSRARDKEAIEIALSQIIIARNMIGEPEIAADALRQAGDALARLLGKLEPEHILGQIFSSFCIGK